jgi:hypothetical protein
MDGAGGQPYIAQAAVDADHSEETRVRNYIAATIAVLGTLLVLGGAATILSRAWFNRPPAEEQSGSSGPSYAVAEPRSRLMRLSPPERLIAWGAVLLVLAAIAAGAISFTLGASAPPK